MTTYWKAVRPDGTDFHTGSVLWAPPAGHVGDDVIAEASRSTGPARFYRLPPGEKRDILAQAIARLYPTEGS